ncbi:MAG TPA: acetyl-CoA hydrolase/transferase C-terminal domain-containing protein [Syntrophales bacterium]|nr:acetyl-CoA hydrolase/transferase C-terminal domain-containing protein [Syntrophales bacterium]HOM06382.1 acetyl-CoA hydrolase/transferase C-terminal domain-containing protein [Syntrophales bacterium]HON99167.1 acetyl-CoA hydrolase/transferase C-terminal domain-containing protein [Syntrophales bacterium]HPC00275.1 acetyl-CoA hydrolase/transferase C-terminal domain-containing protein [Syntrophales bacterium]HPQ05938.1 acetyl-CoA hydrolase/transferase C-terminal domain-containing protein [Syntr
MPQPKIENKEKIHMPTPLQQKLRDKTITAKKWAEMVKPGDWINRGGPGSDTFVTMEALAARLGNGPGDLYNIEIWNQAIMCGNNFLAAADQEAKYHVIHEAFLLPTLRGLVSKGYKGLDWKHWGWALGMDAEYARFYRKNRAERAMDWGVQACAVPQAGFVNASYGVNNFMITAKSCKKFVCEIRSDYAWCEGGRETMYLPIDEVDYFIEVDVDDPKYQWPYIAEKNIQPTEVEKKIAANILSIMRDGDCIQVGIGALPTAVVIALRDSDLRHIGVHSEMIGEYAFTLTEAGVADNSRKTIDKGRCGWAYIMPVDTPRYYEWLHHNPYFAGYDVGYTNNVATLSQIDNFVAVNNFAQMDLRGQDAAGNVGGRPISSTGGQLQFIIGASMARGGRGVLAATSRDAKGKSRFVPMLEPGSVVAVPDQLVTYICTEWGIVNIQGCTDAEKAAKIISIAHPDDREWLAKEAVDKLGIKLNHWMFTNAPDRRFPTAEQMKDHKYGYMDLEIKPRPIAKYTD